MGRAPLGRRLVRIRTIRFARMTRGVGMGSQIVGSGHEGLARRRLGVGHIFFFTVAASAPMTVLGGRIPTAFAVTGVNGVPLAFPILAVALALFVVGYAAMSRYVFNAGAFYSYVATGLGRADPPGAPEPGGDVGVEGAGVGDVPAHRGVADHEQRQRDGEDGKCQRYAVHPGHGERRRYPPAEHGHRRRCRHREEEDVPDTEPAPGQPFVAGAYDLRSHPNSSRHTGEPDRTDTNEAPPEGGAPHPGAPISSSSDTHGGGHHVL